MIASLIALQMIGTWVQMPPARYDHPYKPLTKIMWADYPTTARLCQNPRAAACTFRHPGRTCIIVINIGYKGTWTEPLIRRHENGHCWGWTAAHEQ